MVVISSPANPAVKAARKLVRRHGRAHRAAEFLVEGPQAVSEAAQALGRVFVAESAEGSHRELLRAARERGVDVLVVADPLLAELASTVTPQGIVGVATLPALDLESVVAGATLLVVLHQVRDPGNAGTAIRSADAAGADAVILTRGSVDPRNDKAVRASAGSLFHLPVLDNVAFGDVTLQCATHGLQVVGLAADGATDHTQADLAGRVAVVVGNEAHGLPTAVRTACDAVVRVPLHDRPRPGFTATAESLNLAATVAVVLFEAARQRRTPPHGAARGAPRGPTR